MEKRALVFVNGEIHDLESIRGLIRPDDLLAAADGGARHLTALGLRPSLLVGDLDSLTPAEVDLFRSAGVEIRQYPREKDETDLELTLLAVQQLGYTCIRVVGGLGGRLDQTLGNLFLLDLPELASCDVRLEDGRDEVFLIRGQAMVQGRPGEVVSLLPLGAPARGITTQGLRYPLRGETLWPERSRGISNELLGEEARVTLSEGALICIHTHLA